MIQLPVPSELHELSPRRRPQRTLRDGLAAVLLAALAPCESVADCAALGRREGEAVAAWLAERTRAAAGVGTAIAGE